MIFNGIFKIPMQFFILLLGVMVFVFYEFNSAPINFNPQVTNYIEKSNNANYNNYLEKYSKIQDQKKDILNDYINKSRLDNNLITKIHSEERKIKTQIYSEIKSENPKIEILDKETGISPGQACVFYSKDDYGDKVLGGGWINKTFNNNYPLS